MQFRCTGRVDRLKGNPVRPANRVYSGAAPATVGGEPFSERATGLCQHGPGRWKTVTTREPGDLPERSHPSGVRGARTGRASAVVTCRIVTRSGTAMDAFAFSPAKQESWLARPA